MKIWHVLWSLTFGGIETMVVNIANEQSAAGHDVSLVLINDLYEESLLHAVSNKVKIINIKRRQGTKNPMFLLRLNMQLIKEAPDVVHCHNPQIERLLLIHSKSGILSTLHAECIPSHVKDTKRVRNLFVISPHVYDSVLTNTGKEGIIVRNGINVEAFKKKERFYDGSGPFKIIQLGRLEFFSKAQDITIKAIRLLKDRGLDVAIDIIGDGPSKGELEAMVKEYGLEDRVKLIGKRSPEYLREHLSDYDLLVNPSRHEGFGLVIAEAMAAKVPVLVSDIASQMEIIDEGRCGYFFDNENAEEMARALERIMADYDCEIIERAHKRVCENYSVKRTAEEYLANYSEILKRK